MSIDDEIKAASPCSCVGMTIGFLDWNAEKLEIERMKYEQFVARKLAMKVFDGIEGDVGDIDLMPFQRDLTAWALRKGASGALCRYRTRQDSNAACMGAGSRSPWQGSDPGPIVSIEADSGRG
jgi:hypothetical protein